MSVRALIRSAWRRARGGRQPPHRIALAVALGLFIGSLPLYGAHFFLCLLVCLPLGLDLLVVYAAANISNPLVAPFLILSEVELGSLVLHGQLLAFDLARARATGVVGFVLEAAIGSVLVGAGLAALGFVIGLFVARKLGSRERPAPDAREELELAVARTVSRYRSAPLGVRYYVAGKLAGDPLAAELATIGPLGRVLDAGCGRGQFALLLLELGRTGSVFGLDADERKVQFAAEAAQGRADFSVGDLARLAEPDAETVLLIDVLHYLDAVEQRALLERLSAARAVERLVIRELDAVAGRASAWTRFAEWIATRTRYNRATRKLSYRSAAELRAELEGLGWRCDVRSASRGTPFGNVLTIATRA